MSQITTLPHAVLIGVARTCGSTVGPLLSKAGVRYAANAPLCIRSNVS